MFYFCFYAVNKKNMLILMLFDRTYGLLMIIVQLIFLQLTHNHVNETLFFLNSSVMETSTQAKFWLTKSQFNKTFSFVYFWSYLLKYNFSPVLSLLFSSSSPSFFSVYSSLSSLSFLSILFNTLSTYVFLCSCSFFSLFFFLSPCLQSVRIREPRPRLADRKHAFQIIETVGQTSALTS